MFGLKMIKDYLNEILDGSKTFDARSYPTSKRGKIALIDSRLMKIYGTIELLSLRFKLSNYTSSLRRFIYSTSSLGIYYQYDKLHFIIGNTITDLCNVTFNEWNNLVVYYKRYSINNVIILIYINDEYQTSGFHILKTSAKK